MYQCWKMRFVGIENGAHVFSDVVHCLHLLTSASASRLMSSSCGDCATYEGSSDECPDKYDDDRHIFNGP